MWAACQGLLEQISWAAAVPPSSECSKFAAPVLHKVRLKLPHHDLNWTSTKHWRRQASLSFRKSTSRRGQHLSQHHTDISVGVLPGPFYPTTLVVQLQQSVQCVCVWLHVWWTTFETSLYLANVYADNVTLLRWLTSLLCAMQQLTDIYTHKR